MPELTENVEVSIEFEVYCDQCGTGICANTTVTVGKHRGIPQLRIEPCDKCLDSARKEGYDEGHSDGYDKGVEEGAQNA